MEIVQGIQQKTKSDHPSLRRSPNVNADASLENRISPNYTHTKKIPLDPQLLERHRCVGLLHESSEHDAYNLLRTRIGQRMDSLGAKTLMITSLNPFEGKTVTAINLAAMFAREYQRTALLVDADLRVQAVGRMLGHEGGKGLVDHLLENEPIGDIMVYPGFEKLTIIAGSRTYRESAELLGSPRMERFVQEVKQRYADRLILFDAPALSGRADGLTLAALVDAVAIVVAADRTPLPDIQAALELIPREKVVGFVLNRRR